MLELLWNFSKASEAWFGLSMSFEELSGFAYVEYGESSTSTTFELLAIVDMDAKLLKDLAEEVVYLLLRGLVGEIPYKDLHTG